MQISLFKDTATDTVTDDPGESRDTAIDNPGEIRVHVKVSATDGAKAQFSYSHFFDLKQCLAGRDIAVEVFDQKPPTSKLIRYGKLLFRALFSEGDSPACELLQNAILSQPTGRVLLNLNGDGDLDTIPWEYAWRTEYLVHQCMFARVHKPTELQLPKLPLRIVAVVPDPVILPDHTNLPDLHLCDQFQNFIDGHHSNTKKILLERVFPPTIDRMDALLMNKPKTATVLHFMGHCAAEKGSRTLIFEHNQTGGPEYIDTLRLVSIPKNLRLAYLSACDTRDVARILLEHGVPYTVGSFCSLPDDFARYFESKFYQLLAGGFSVEKAMWRARVFLNGIADPRQRDYIPGAIILYSSRFREDDGAFECEEGKPMVDLHMPAHNLEFMTTSTFRGRKQELIDLGYVLRRMANRQTDSYILYTINGIRGQGKTALAMEAIRRTAHLFPGGIFAWRFDRMEMSVIEYLKWLVEVIFPHKFQSLLKILGSGDGDDVQRFGSAIIKEFAGHPTCLLVLDHADILIAEKGDENCVKLRDWLRRFALNGAVKILATATEPLGWAGEMSMPLSGMTNDGGIELFILNLDYQVKKRMETEENTAQLLQDLVKLVDGHPLCLKSLARAVCLLQHREVSLGKLVRQHGSTLLGYDSNESTNLGTLFRPTIDMIPTLERQLLYMCSLFTGPITDGVLEFVRHFVECVDTSELGIDSSETIAKSLQQLCSRGLASKKVEEYSIQFALREGAKLCNSMLKIHLRLPIPGLFNDTFVIGVVKTSHAKSMVLKWQLRNIQAKSYRKTNTRGFGICYYSIESSGHKIFDIPGINEQGAANADKQHHASYQPLVVFIYNMSKGNHDSFPQFGRDQIKDVIKETQAPFILCLSHTDETSEEQAGRTTSFLAEAAKILGADLETHWIIRMEAPSASKENKQHENVTKKNYRKHNDGVRMEGPFIGRTEDLEKLVKLLEGSERYITIKGFGGIGKTSLALQVFKHFNSGDALALSLAGPPRASQVIRNIAKFFTIATNGLKDKEQLSRVLENLEGETTFLLYLDNMEDLKQAMENGNDETKREARALINFFKGLPENVKILATSRIALGWPDEYLIDLAGLPPHEGVQVFRHWIPQRSKMEDADQSVKELSIVTDGHPLSLRLLGGLFDNSMEPIKEFITKARERLRDAVNEEFINERHKSMNACIQDSFDSLDRTLQAFLVKLRGWKVPFTSTLVSRTLKDDDRSGSSVSDNLHRLWQRSWLNVRKYQEDPMIGEWRPKIIKGDREFYSLHPRLHDFLNHQYPEDETAILNDKEIQFYTALCYGVGFGVANDLAMQIEWCTKAADNGHVEAQLTLAACYQGGCGVNPDEKKAFDMYLKAVESGNERAQSELAWCYRWGNGVNKDLKKADFWKNKSKNRTATAMFDLSLPLIHRAVKVGDVAMVKSLMQHPDTDVNVRDRAGYTPLHWAAKMGHIDIIESLLFEFDANKYPRDRYGNTPLQHAAISGCTEIVWLFVVEYEADSNNKSDHGWTPLHQAALHGHVEIAKLLLFEFGADANAKTKEGSTPLHFASKNGHVEIVELLVSVLAKLPTMTTLYLHDIGIGEIGARALGESLKQNTTLIEINLYNNRIGDEGAHALAEALKQITTLAEVDLSYNGIGEEGARALAESLKQNTTLTYLDLYFNSIGEEGTRALAESLKQNTTLTYLNLYGNRIGKEGACALAASLNQNTTLTKLNLENNSIGEEGARAIAESLKQNMTLTTLHLSYNSIGEEGARTVAESLKQNTTLTELNLFHNSIGEEGARALAGSLKQNTTLIDLNLENNGIGGKGTRALAESLKQNTSLIELNISDNSIDEEGARALAESLKQNTTLTGLNLSNNSIGDEGARALAESLKQNTTLTDLNLERNEISHEAADALAESSKKKTLFIVLNLDNSMNDKRARAIAEARQRKRTLTTLNFKHNSIGSLADFLNGNSTSTALNLEELLKQNMTLTTLNLESNKIGPKGVSTLAEFLRQNMTLTTLNLDYNGIGDDGTCTLVEALKLNSTVTTLNLGKNSIGDKGACALADILRKKMSLTELILDYNSIGNDGARTLAKSLQDNITLTTLNLDYNSISYDGAEALAGSLQGSTILTVLNLGRNKIDQRGASVLAESLRQNKTLTTLNLCDNRIGNEGASALAESLNHNATLMKLNLGGNGISNEGARALAESLKQNTNFTTRNDDHDNISEEVAFAVADSRTNTTSTPQNYHYNSISDEVGNSLAQNLTLTELDLSNNYIGNGGADALAKSLEQNATLVSLNLEYNGIGDEGTSALADSLCLNMTFKALNLKGNHIGDIGACSLAKYLEQNMALTTLDLSSSNIGDKGASNLAMSLKNNTTLTELKLDYNRICNIGVLDLARALEHNRTLRVLNLNYNSIGNDSVCALAKSLKNNMTLTVLNLGNNCIGPVGARYLAKSLNLNATLTTLNLKNNHIGSNGAYSLAKPLKRNTTLTWLNIANNHVNNSGACFLAESLKQNTTLTSLNLENNNIGDMGASSLAKSLEQNTTLIELNLRGNDIGDEQRSELVKFLKLNVTYAELNLERSGIDENDILVESLNQNQTASAQNVFENEVATLEVLNVADNIGYEGVQSIAESPRQDTTLTEPNLFENTIGDQGTHVKNQSQMLLKLKPDNKVVGKMTKSLKQIGLKINTKLKLSKLEENI